MGMERVGTVETSWAIFHGAGHSDLLQVSSNEDTSDRSSSFPCALFVFTLFSQEEKVISHQPATWKSHRCRSQAHVFGTLNQPNSLKSAIKMRKMTDPTLPQRCISKNKIPPIERPCGNFHPPRK